MEFEQPTLMNVDEFAPHVDDLEPGTLTREQWRARSDVHYHSGDNREWDTNYADDVAVHVGDAEQAAYRGGEFTHRLRVPKEKVSSKLLSDAGANEVHLEAARAAGLDPDQSIMESVEFERGGVRTLHDGTTVAVTEPDIDDLDTFSRGKAFPYVNEGEGVRRSPGSVRAETYGKALIVPQRTARTWAQDVDESAARTPPHIREETGWGPSPNVLHQRQFFGNVGDVSESYQQSRRDTTMDPFRDGYNMPHLPNPEPDGVPARTFWHRTSMGWNAPNLNRPVL